MFNRLLTLASLLLPVSIAASCVAVDDGATGNASNGAKPAKADEEGAELVAKKRELERAYLELDLARMDSKNTNRAAKEALADAEWDLDDARRALKVFQESEKPLKLQSAELDLGRQQLRLEEQRQELDELKQHYAKEAFAGPVKELVLMRATRRLELTQEGVSMQQRKLALLVESELPDKERELEWAFDEAKRERRQAKEKVVRTRLEKQLAVLGKRHKVAKLEEEVEEKGGAEAVAEVKAGKGKKPAAKPEETPAKPAGKPTETSTGTSTGEAKPVEPQGS